jgi:tetratricopeptide (TPR) repeat protein/predicted Ser/Thr protein kinase
MMDDERWRKVERIYHSALAQESSQRAAFLDRECGGNESLLQDIRSLLEQSERASGFLELPAMDVAARALADSVPAAADSVPAVIGRYRVIRLLGEGGMGIVYEAEQEQPRRVVALKVIRPGLATRERLRRFEQECQALGRLQHPGIAQIYEAGVAGTSQTPQPYFAMELIRGLALDKFVKQNSLDTRQKMALVMKVCEAVHHAHQRGLIHRDLKPGNILVDETGQPKILDFGVARVTGMDAHENAAQPTIETGVGQIVGTLAYMSPEQVAGDPLEVDTRSDVYSLGVILYEILSGRLPYEAGHRQLPEAVRAIREEDPKPLSSISRNYRGDIETITGKALEKDKARRYSSAAELAGDIQRYLNDEPIAARPPSAGYQLQKFTRRNRAMVAGLAAVFLVLVAGVTVSTLLAIRANRAGQAAVRERDRAVAAEANAVQERNRALAEKQRADDQAAVSEAVSDFLQNDLLAQAGSRTQAGPRTKPDPDLKVRTALDRAAARIAGKFDKQPLVEASIRQTTGFAYYDLGIYPEAQKQLERAVDLRRRLLGEDHADTLSVMNDLIWLYRDEGKYAQAEPLAGKVLETRKRLLGEEHPDTISSMRDLGLVYRFEGKSAEAERLLRKALDIRRRISGEENEATLRAMNDLGYVHQVEGNYLQAERLLSKVFTIRRRVSGQEHPDTLIAMDNLATVYYRQRKYTQAESLFAKNLEIRKEVLGEEHPGTLDTINNLGVVYRAEGKFAEAAILLGKVLETKRRVLGEEHPSTSISMINVAVLYRYQGDYSKAESLMARGVELQSRLLSEEHPDRLAGMSRLAALYSDEGKYTQAEEFFTKALKIQLRVLGAVHPETLISWSGLGRLQLREHKYAGAEATLREALKGYDQAMPDSWERFNGQSMLGESLERQEKYAEAEPIAISGYAGMLKRAAEIPVQDRPLLSQAGGRIVQLYESWGKPEKAEGWRETLKKDQEAIAEVSVSPSR